MSSIPYSGGTIVDTTFVGDTRANIASNIITQLTNAGWTSYSGSGTDQVMKSASTADGNQIYIRVQDPGSGNCAKLTLRNGTGTRISGISQYLLPAALKTFRIICCKYNFFVFTPGSSAAREFACGGTLSLPSFLSGYLTGDLGFLQGNASSDGDTSVRISFRTRLGQNNANTYFTGLANDALYDLTGDPQNGTPQLIQRGASFWTWGNCQRWVDGTHRNIEAELAWGITGNSSEAKSFGYIHNCFVNSQPWTVDDRTVTSYDGHAWHAITDNNTGTNGQHAGGTLFVAIS